MLVDDIISAIETARDKVVADEIRQLVKLGLPKNMAQKTVHERFHLKAEEDENGTVGGGEFDATQWRDIG